MGTAPPYNGARQRRRNHQPTNQPPHMKPTIKPRQVITIHRDGTVSLWDIISQQWRRLPAGDVPAAILATLTEAERSRIAAARK